jgi:hypothetical protein
MHWPAPSALTTSAPRSPAPPITRNLLKSSSSDAPAAPHHHSQPFRRAQGEPATAGALQPEEIAAGRGALVRVEDAAQRYWRCWLEGLGGDSDADHATFAPPEREQIHYEPERDDHCVEQEHNRLSWRM